VDGSHAIFILKVRGFSAEDISFEEIAFDGRAVYRVALTTGRSHGMVSVTASRHVAGGAEVWIAQQLNELSPAGGLDAVLSRVYSPLHLD
jgi:hypothetical protein